MTTVLMQAPASYSSPNVRGLMMPSGTSYHIANGVVQAQPADVAALIGLGFVVLAAPGGKLIADTAYTLSDNDAFQTLWFETNGTVVSIPLGLMLNFQVLIVDGSGNGDLTIAPTSPGPTMQGNLTSGGSFAVISITGKPTAADYYVVGGNTTA